jgi:lipoate-protein ligase A
VSEWEILDSGCQRADENMHLDSELLGRADQFSRPILHLYEWAGDSATYGHFIDPSQFLNLDSVRTLGLQLARRPTGGGIVFHMWDMAFSVLIPASCPEFSLNTLDNYAFVNHAVLCAAREFLDQPSQFSLISKDCHSWDTHCGHFCMAKPTKYDLVWKERKIAGAAQRKTRKGFLHQGTIAMVPPNEEYLTQVLLPGTKVREAMRAHTHPLCSQQSELTDAKKQLRSLLATHLRYASLKLI